MWSGAFCGICSTQAISFLRDLYDMTCARAILWLHYHSHYRRVLLTVPNFGLGWFSSCYAGGSSRVHPVCHLRVSEVERCVVSYS